MCLGGHFLRSFTEVGRPTLNVGDNIRADWGLGANEREKNELSFSFSLFPGCTGFTPAFEAMMRCSLETEPKGAYLLIWSQVLCQEFYHRNGEMS